MLRLQSPLPERYTDAPRRRAGRRIEAAKPTLGDRVFILGHHYQRDEVMRWADARGDSYRLSVLAQQRPEAEYIVFCGVHFMAESADVLTADHQQVVLPDLNAGCSMADMADLDEVEEAWEALAEVTDIDRVVPITYMNSSAALKAFVGAPRRRGVHLHQRPAGARVGPGRRRRREGDRRPVRGRRGARSCSSPTSTWAATPASASASPRRHAGVEPPPASSAVSPTPTARTPRSCCGRATARCTSASGPSTSPPSAPSTPTAS